MWRYMSTYPVSNTFLLPLSGFWFVSYVLIVFGIDLVLLLFSCDVSASYEQAGLVDGDNLIRTDLCVGRYDESSFDLCQFKGTLLDHGWHGLIIKGCGHGIQGGVRWGGRRIGAEMEWKLIPEMFPLDNLLTNPRLSSMAMAVIRYFFFFIVHHNFIPLDIIFHPPPPFPLVPTCVHLQSRIQMSRHRWQEGWNQPKSVKYSL